MDGDLARTYTLVYAFLVKHAHVKAAQALKKSVKESLILKDDATPEGPSLDDIIRSYPRPQDEDQDEDSDDSLSGSSSSSSSSSDIKETKLAKKGNKSSKSSSSSESSSESESEKSSPETNAKKSSKANFPSTSSVDDGSSDSEPDEKLKSMIPKAERTSSRTLSSNDPSSPESESSETPKKKHSVSSKEKRPKRSTSSTTSDSESDSSSEDSDPQSKSILDSTSKGKASSNSSRSKDSAKLKRIDSANTSTTKKREPTRSKVEKKKSFSTPPAQDIETRVTKKRKTDVEGNSVATAIDVTRDVEERPQLGGEGKTGKAPRSTNNRFSRVNASKFQSTVDNRYGAKNAPVNDYGKRAHQDLIITRGAGFRKEKNKKKRGSYRGGEITMESHSFKFS